jgi:murein DD-endopeptidase MepM/ murein hydrolase activator NlpD
MRDVAPRTALVAALSAACFVLSAAVSSGGDAAIEASAKASAYGISVVVPGGSGASAGVVSAPPDASGGGALSYPADGSAVQAPAVSASATTTGGKSATATSSADVTSLSLFGGEITLASAAARARAGVKGRLATADVSSSSVQGLVVLGQPVEGAPGVSVAAGDWGQVTVLEGGDDWKVSSGRNALTASVLALRVRLTKEHGGLPAGSEILVGRAEATAQPPPPDPATARPQRRTGTESVAPTRGAPTPTKPRRAREPGRSRPRLPLVRRFPPNVTPPLTAGGYVFPVYGPSSWSDTFRAPRAAPVGWHHGIDIFAPLGAPLLAVADGTLFSVGWNDIGGYRLWLQDGEGNEFYYAHLSAFSTLAAEGAQVRAGDVIGFVGSTGDAESTPYHLHFEIHPVSMKRMGYDGVVNPTPYLLAWQKLEDVPIVGVAGWAAPIAPASRAPRPGAILLQMTDISSASGLEPGSLRDVLSAPRSLTAEGALAAVKPRASRP